MKIKWGSYPDPKPARIYNGENVFIGSAGNQVIFGEFSITHTVGCELAPTMGVRNIEFRSTALKDEHVLHQVISRIEEAVRQPGGNVLVHCWAGISCSASVCVAYLIKAKGLSLEAALKAVQDARNIAKPDEGSMELLALWEKNCREEANLDGAGN